MKPVKLHRLAKLELQDALQHYEELCQGLGSQFLLRFKDATERIQWNPLMFATEEVSEARLSHIDQFPLYAIVYVILDPKIWIIAVANQRRRPRYWSRRLPRSRS